MRNCVHHESSLHITRDAQFPRPYGLCIVCIMFKDARYILICILIPNILTILTELTLQKQLHNFVINYVFLTKRKTTTKTKHTVKHKNHCQTWELNPGPYASGGCVTSGPKSQLKELIVVKL